jgi:hypothetical protein
MTVANCPSALLTVPAGAAAVVAVPVPAAAVVAPVLVLDVDELVCSNVVLLAHPAIAEALRIMAARRLARIAVEAR